MNFYPYIFLSLVAIYYVSPYEANGEFSILAAILKILPIVYLVFYMKSFLRTFKSSQSTKKGSSKDIHWEEKRHLATYVTYGFVFSLIGDFVLLIRVHSDCYLLVGTAAFAVAQTCYIYAFGFKVIRAKIGLIIYVSTGILSTYILWDVESPLKLVLTGYGALLVSALWRAIDRTVHDDGRPEYKKLMLAVGLFVFLLSDFWLSFSTFVLKEHCVHSMHFILYTYYISQGMTAFAST